MRWSRWKDVAKGFFRSLLLEIWCVLKEVEIVLLVLFCYFRLTYCNFRATQKPVTWRRSRFWWFFYSLSILRFLWHGSRNLNLRCVAWINDREEQTQFRFLRSRETFKRIRCCWWEAVVLWRKKQTLLAKIQFHLILLMYHYKRLFLGGELYFAHFIFCYLSSTHCCQSLV